jgi:Tfp pilus assembly protein PilN
MSNRLNLARRPFVDTRPANVTVGVLALVALVLSLVAWRTVSKYYRDSARTRGAISALQSELDALDKKKQAREATVARYDVPALAASARDANSIARWKAFSWSRFLSRLEKTLPDDDRITAIALSRPDPRALEAGADAYGLSLEIVSRSADALPGAIRAFYASRWFDNPVPHSEQTPDKAKGVGWVIHIDVTYLDSGKKP